MLREEPLANVARIPGQLYKQQRLPDALIRARETVLNQLTGVKPALVINRGLPEVSMEMPADLAARLKQTLDEL